MPIKFERLYGVATTLDFVLYDTDGIDFNATATHASGDTLIMKDEGAEANTANGFTDEGTGYSLALTATETNAARIVVYVVDQGTKVWLDEALIVETYGNENSQHPRRNPGVILETTIASVSSQNPLTFIVTDKPNDNNTLLNSVVEVIDNSTPDAPPDRGFTGVETYTGSTGQCICAAGTFPFTVAAGDLVRFSVTADVSSAAEIADAVWDEAKSGHTTADTFGKILQDVETDVAAVQSTADTIDSTTSANASAIDTNLTAINAVAGNILPVANTTFSDLSVLMVRSDDHVTPFTGGTPTVTRSIDGGTFAAATGTVSETGQGIYQLDASAADMNGSLIVFKFEDTGADDSFITVTTTPAP